MYGYKKRTYRRAGKSMRKSAPKRTYKRRSNFTKKVQRVVTKMAEKKQTTTTQINDGITTGDNTILMKNIPLTPILSQGSAENGRVGNCVRVTYGVISGYINMLPYNVATNTFPALKVRLMLVSYKNRNVSALSAPNLVVGDFDTFYDNGGNGVPAQGNIYDILAPVNTQRWVIHAQKIIDLSLTGSSTAYPNTTAPIQSGTFSKYFKFTYGKHLGKLVFDDNVGSNYPTNKNLFLLVQPVTADGSARQAGPVAEMHYKIDTQYTDL